MGEADGVVVEWGAEGGAAAELPEAAEEPGGVVEFFVAIFAGDGAGDAALFYVGDEDVGGVDRNFEDGGEGVALPGHHEPEGVGVRGFEGGLD